MKKDKLLLKLLSGKSDRNFAFNDLRKILLNFGFKERIKGSHHIYTKEEVDEIINIQPKEANKAKAYQVKQIRELIVKYKLNANEA